MNTTDLLALTLERSISDGMEYLHNTYLKMKQKKVGFPAEEVRDGDGCLIKMRMTAAKKEVPLS